jgi:probable phosphoglycerate mutase
VAQRFEQRPYTRPAGATEIVLVRHGASAAAVEGQPFPLLEGRSDPPLADAGHEQARRVAERLAGEVLDALYVSPLQRTGQTAAPLAELSGLQPRVLGELAEVGLGAFEGGEYRIRLARRDPTILRVFEEERWDAIPGAEPAEHFAARVHRAIERIVELTGPDTTAVAVAHGGVIGEVCRQATGSRPFAFVHASNGSLTRLVVRPDGRWLLLTFNDLAHLPVPAVV